MDEFRYLCKIHISVIRCISSALRARARVLRSALQGRNTDRACSMNALQIICVAMYATTIFTTPDLRETYATGNGGVHKARLARLRCTGPRLVRQRPLQPSGKVLNFL